jgi:hypothetical protein
VWDVASFWLAHSKCFAFIVLPDIPLFLQSGWRPLPCPPWRTAVFFFAGKVNKPRSLWLRYLPQDGDVETNPGPEAMEVNPSNFIVFLTEIAPAFLSMLEPLVLARSFSALHQRLSAASLSTSDLLGFLTPLGECSVEDLPRMIAAYELYAGVLLQFTDGVPSWQPLDDPVVRMLKQEIENLRLVAASSKPTLAPFLPLSGANVEAFSKAPGRPRWMQDLTGIFARWMDQPNSLDPALLLNEVWETMIRAHSSYATRFPRSQGTTHTAPLHNPSQSSSSPNTDFPQRSAARKSPLSLDVLRERGGRVFTEPTPFGVGTFAELDGTRYYLAAKSQTLWDTSCPPPSSCSRCGALHWFWECPALSH